MIITTRTPTSISAATNNAAKYTINTTTLTQVTNGLVMNCSKRGVKISFSILQIMYLKKRNYHKNTPRELVIKHRSRNQWKSILAREENPIVEGRKKLSLLKKHPRGKRTKIPRSSFDSSHEPQPALEMSVPGEEGQRKGIWRRRKGKGDGAERQKARQGCPASGGARPAKLPPMN